MQNWRGRLRFQLAAIKSQSLLKVSQCVSVLLPSRDLEFSPATLTTEPECQSAEGKMCRDSAALRLQVCEILSMCVFMCWMLCRLRVTQPKFLLLISCFMDVFIHTHTQPLDWTVILFSVTDKNTLNSFSGVKLCKRRMVIAAKLILGSYRERRFTADLWFSCMWGVGELAPTHPSECKSAFSVGTIGKCLLCFLSHVPVFG